MTDWKIHVVAIQRCTFCKLFYGPTNEKLRGGPIEYVFAKLDQFHCERAELDIQSPVTNHLEKFPAIRMDCRYFYLSLRRVYFSTKYQT